MSQFVQGAKTLTSGEVLAQYRLVKLDTSRQAVYADANDVPIGYTVTAALTSGDQVAVQPLTKDGTFPAIAADAIPVGSSLYTAADGKVSDTRGGCYVGKYMGTAAAAANDVIEVCPTIASGLTYTTVAASSAVTNTTTETSFGQTYSIPANTLQAGSVIEIISQGIATATNSTDTLNIKVYVNSTAIAASGAVDVADNDIWVAHQFVTIRTNGGSGTFVSAGHISLDAAGDPQGNTFTASTAIDTTAAVTLDVKATWSVASTANSCRQDLFLVRIWS